MPAPTIKRIFKNGQDVWEITYNGMTRHHSQDWQARCLYEQALRLYSLQID